MELESYVPEDVVIVVLSHLSAKAIARFACVSKFWSSVTVEPVFVDMHQHQARKRHPQLLVLFRTRPGCWPDEHTSAESSWPRLYSMDEGAPKFEPAGRNVAAPCRWITSPCNGFVCLHKTGGVQVWNPTTGESLSIRARDSPAVNERFFLGFHRVAQRYKLVRLYKIPDDVDPQQRALCIDVLDFGDSSSWRSIYANHFGYVSVRSTSVCGPDGSMYICIFPIGFIEELVVLAIDLGEEKVVQLSRPPECSRCGRPHVDVLEMDGRLCLGHCCSAQQNAMPQISVYMLMRDDGAVGVWAKKYASGPFDVEQWWDNASVVTILNKKVLLRHKKGLCWYDMRSCKLLDASSFVIDTAAEMVVGVVHPYVESFAPIRRLYS